MRLDTPEYGVAAGYLEAFNQMPCVRICIKRVESILKPTTSNLNDTHDHSYPCDSLPFSQAGFSRGT